MKNNNVNGCIGGSVTNLVGTVESVAFSAMADEDQDGFLDFIRKDDYVLPNVDAEQLGIGAVDAVDVVRPARIRLLVQPLTTTL